jgi:hypothetical protein
LLRLPVVTLREWLAMTETRGGHPQIPGIRLRRTAPLHNLRSVAANFKLAFDPRNPRQEVSSCSYSVIPAELVLAKAGSGNP